MKTQDRSKRIRERLGLKLPVRVRCREALDSEWTEATRLVNITPFGAGFTLRRLIDRGRLLHMTIPMPRQLRAFDYVEDQYRIWALVRHLRSLPSTDDRPLFEVGVAFVGKRAPKSYEENPATRYEIAESVSHLKFADVRQIPGPLPADQRAQTRHSIAVDVLLEALNENGFVEASESTVTEDISQYGATVFTTLAVRIGRFVRLTSQHYNVTVYAVVRAGTVGAHGIPRVHVEFIDRQWPL